jgi:hypothetical protein
MRNEDGAPIEDEEGSEFPGCLIPGILIAVLGSLFLLISELTRIKDIVLCRKLVDLIKASTQKRRLQKRKHTEEEITE